MYREIIESRELFNGLELELSVSCDGEIPNDVFGIWEGGYAHDAGRAVKDAAGDTGFYVSCNYTPAELAKEYAAQGRENPSRAAYESLQKELHHYLHGAMYTVWARVLFEDEELSNDSIGFDFSDYVEETLEEAAERVAEDHFSWRALICEARREAKAKAARLSSITSQRSA